MLSLTNSNTRADRFRDGDAESDGKISALLALLSANGALKKCTCPYFRQEGVEAYARKHLDAFAMATRAGGC